MSHWQPWTDITEEDIIGLSKDDLLVMWSVAFESMSKGEIEAINIEL